MVADELAPRLWSLHAGKRERNAISVVTVRGPDEGDTTMIV
jgi:hypothetical protein